jgi:ATP-binding cassette subfamily B (MDR/TAP) protein 1
MLVAYPLQAYFFAKVVEVFTFTKSEMIARGNFWCWMFVALAMSTGYSFFAIGWSAAITAVVCGEILFFLQS